MSTAPHFEQPPIRRYQIHGRLNLSVADLRVVKRSGFDMPIIADWVSFGPIGMPSLPQQLQYVVLPGRESRIFDVHVDLGISFVLPGHHSAYPVQPPVIPPRTVREFSVNSLSDTFVKMQEPYPDELVVVGKPRLRDGFQFFPLHIRPVQYDPVAKTFVFYPKMQFVIHYEMSGEARLFDRPSWLDRLGQETPLLIPEGLFSEQVKYVGAMRHQIPSYFPAENIPYVIITDNVFWPESVAMANNIRPPKDTEEGAIIGLEGNGGCFQDGPVGHFERLAKWKTSRGVRTRVVTIKDILANKFIDCTEAGFARDLQEVIRNFIVKIHDHWKTEYVLLGGHPRIVPIRQFLGHINCNGSYPGWDFYKYDETTNIEGGGPPPRGRMYFNNIMMLCHDRGLGEPDMNTVLVTAAGKKILWKGNSDESLGWYFEDKYFQSGPCAQPMWFKNPKDFGDTPKDKDICNIVVEGSKAIIDDDMHWAFPERLVPTDLYYAELAPTSSQYGHCHAFDSNNNGFYGEYRWVGSKDDGMEMSIDGVDVIVADVQVGRAPVLSGREAQYFVDKVLAYETLVNADGEAIDPQYLNRKLVVADVWRSADHVADHLSCMPGKLSPDEGEFIGIIEASGQAAVIVHLQSKIALFLKNNSSTSTRLVGRFYAQWGGSDVPIVKKGEVVDSTKNTWQFVIYNSQRVVISDSPSNYVMLSGPAFAHQQPERVLWYYSHPDSFDDATTQSEELVEEGFDRFEEFNTERCVIETYAAPSGSIPLNASNIRKALDRGQHLVGVYGHGSENGLSYIYWHDNDAASQEFRNVDRPFIMYANSCLTANPTHPDVRSLGEILVTHKNGAVAYVGYTRYGFQEGHNQQQRFFKKLYSDGRLGRAARVQNAETLWQTYEQILYGDPEMPVWNKKPRDYLVLHPKTVDRTVSFKVSVLAKEDGKALQNQMVTLMAGWRGSDKSPLFLTTAITSQEGIADFDMSDWPESETNMFLTVVSKYYSGFSNLYVPYRTTLPVYGYQRGWRRCKHCQALFHLNERGSYCPREDSGQHEAADGEKYHVIINSVISVPATEIQQGWRWCRKCQALHFPGDGEACHLTSDHDSGSSNYAVEIISIPNTDRPSWRFCDKCRVLHLVVKGETGPCYGGGLHNASGSFYHVERY